MKNGNSIQYYRHFVNGLSQACGFTTCIPLGQHLNTKKGVSLSYCSQYSTHILYMTYFQKTRPYIPNHFKFHFYFHPKLCKFLRVAAQFRISKCSDYTYNILPANLAASIYMYILLNIFGYTPQNDICHIDAN